MSTLPMDTHIEEQSFVVDTPTGRARLLSFLRTHTDTRAAGHVRDVLLRFARKETDFNEVKEVGDALGITVLTAPHTPAQTLSTEEEKETQDVKEISESAPSHLSASFGRLRPIPTFTAPVSDVVVLSVEDEKVKTVDTNPQVVEDNRELSQKTGSDIDALRSRVHTINSSLNEFAHGKAFQWLGNPQTGYREYMNELIALRSILQGENLSEADIAQLPARVTRLEEMANAVRVSVGGVATQQQPVESVSTPPTEESQVHDEQADYVPLPPSPPDPPPPQPEAGLVDQIPMQEHSVIPPDMTQEYGTSHESAENSPQVEEVAQAVLEEAPRVEVVEVPSSETQNSFVSQETDIPVPPPPTSPPGTGNDPSLYAPDVDIALNNLLTQWLGTTGFLGFGDSGVRHPDWLHMKDLFVEDVFVDDGVIPPGLRPETYDNLRQNVRAWSSKYGLYNEFPTETVENFLRRVVRASMSSGL